MTDDDELVREVARAIYEAPNGIDGDPIGVMLAEGVMDAMDASDAQAKGLLVSEHAARAALARFREIMRERVPYRIDGPGVKGPHAAAYLDGRNAARREILGDDA